MALVQLLLNQHPGPLPIHGTFQCRSSEVVDVIVTGVSYRKTGAPLGLATVEIVIIDDSGREVGKASGTADANRAGGWKPMVSQFGQMKLEAGATYKFTVRAASAEVDSSPANVFTATIVY